MKAISINIDERPDLVVSFERIVLNTYKVAKGENRIKINDILFVPLKIVALVNSFIAKIITSMVAMSLLVFLVILLIICLSYGNLLFYLMKDQIRNTLKTIDRKYLINRHLKVENALRHLNSMKGSKVLFSAPILGQLNSKFLNNLIYFEFELKKIAYPDLNKIPEDLPIHDYNPNDPWQDDLDEYSQSEIFTVH